MELIGQGEDLRHWGSYDAVDHGFDARTQGPIGRARRQAAFGTVVPVDPMQVLTAVPGASYYEVRGKLQYIRQELQPAFLNALAPTEFVPTGSAQSGSQAGTIRVSLSTAGPAWFNTAVENGAAVLLDLATATSTEPIFVISADPSFVGSRARAGGPYVIVAIPPALDAQAQAQVPQPVPVPPPPSGRPSVPTQGGEVPWGMLLAGGLLLAGVGYLVFRERR